METIELFVFANDGNVLGGDKKLLMADRKWYISLVWWQSNIGFISVRPLLRALLAGLFLFVSVVAEWDGTSARASESEDGATISFEFANEDQGFFGQLYEPFFDPVFGDKAAEGHLTWAWRLSYTPHRTDPKWFRPIHGALPWLDDAAEVRTSSSVQQLISLPDKPHSNMGYSERPAVGFLSYEERIGLSSPLQTHSQRIDTLAMTLGVAGPLSGARVTHNAAHVLLAVKGESWPEIDSEPVVNVSYEHARRFFLLKSHAPENLEFMPYAGVALGNAFTHASLGATLRVGRHLDKDNGALRLGPLLNGANFSRKGDYWSWNWFVGVEGRAVGRNIFLDGNTFADSHSVDSRPFVYEAQMGFEFGKGATRFSTINLWRSREFKSQGESDQLLKLMFSYSY